jgi:hypothetical protein
MVALFHAVVSWHTLLVIVLMFGFLPGFVLRLLVMIYPRDDPRRCELVAQLYTLDRLERPLFVAEQLETVLFEGVPHRLSSLARSFRRWRYAPLLGMFVFCLAYSTPLTIAFMLEEHPRVHPLAEPMAQPPPDSLIIVIFVVVSAITAIGMFLEGNPGTRSRR